MNRLKYPQKFVLISLLFIAPLALAMWQFFSVLDTQIVFTQAELAGTQYLRPLRQLLEHTLQQKTLAYEYLHGRDEAASDLARVRLQVAEDLRLLSTLDDQLGASLQTTARFSALVKTWQDLNDSLDKRETERNHLQHIQLLKDTLELMRVIGDNSNLILDPELDSYYLMNAVVLELPKHQSLLADIVFLTEQIIRNGKLTEADKAELTILQSETQATLANVKRNLEISFRTTTNAKLSGQLTQALVQTIDINDATLNTLARDLITPGAVNLQPTAFRALSQGALHTSFELWDRTLFELDGLLQTRIDNFNRQKWLISGATTIILIAVAYLWVAFYLGVMGTVSSLTKTAQRLVSGDISSTLAIEAHDELGQVVTSFNNVARRLHDEWLQARTESERAHAAELKQRESAQVLEALVRASPLATFVIDPAGYVQMWNPAAERIFGWSEDEVLGRYLPIVPPGQEEEFAILRDVTLKGSALSGAELRRQRKDGTLVDVSAFTAPLRDTQGNVTSIMVVLEDITQRRRNELAVRESEIRLRTLIENAPEAIVVVDFDTNLFTEPNENAAWLFGMDRSSLTKVGPVEMSPPTQPDNRPSETAWQSYLRDALKGGLPVFEWTFRNVKGKSVPCEVRLVWLPVSSRNLVRASITDITTRKHAEQAIRESEERFRTIAEALPIPLIISALRTGIVLYANEPAEPFFGLPLEGLIGSDITEFYQDDADRVRIFRELQANGYVRDYELSGKRANGTPIWTILSARTMRYAGQEAVVGGFYDITERKHIEQALRVSEERNRRLLDSSPDAIVVYDTGGAVTYVNPAFTQTFGWTLDELIGKRLDFVPPDELPAAQEAIRRLYSGEVQTISAETKRYTKNKQTVEALGSAALLRDKDGKPTGIIVTSRDISDRKRAEVELQKAKEAAEAANRAKSQFLANMSHELRTPLNAVIGYSEMLQEEALDIGETGFAADLAKIHAAGRHLLGLINDILDLSKIEAGRMELYLETFDLSKLVNDVMGTVKPLIAQKANTLTVYTDPQLGAMHADQVKVRQILFNLLSNAAKFTEHGNITLTLERRSAFDWGFVPSLPADYDRPNADLPELDEWITLKVQDTGIGMTPEQQAKLFQAFTQADASTTRKYGGTGLGLAITKHFCQMMGGDIAVKSEPNKGSLFTAWLPAHVPDPSQKVLGDEQRASATSDAPAHHATSDMNTVLVIDDDPNVTNLLRRFLTREGFHVVTAANGAEGLRLAREIKPNAITLDVMMPGMDGWSVLSVLKAERELAEIPVIMLTIVDQKNMGYTLGASDYLSKPVDRERLITVLNKYRRAPLNGQVEPVLIVEDDAPTREMIRRMLEKEGCAVVEAENGRVGLQHFDAQKPSLILLDLMMPEMDGFEFVHELRRRDAQRTIPVIIVTAKDLTMEDRLKLNGYVEKLIQKGAYTSEELLQELRTLVKSSLKLVASR